MAQQAYTLRDRSGRTPLRRAMLRLQRGVHRRMQAEVRAHTGGHSPALERYYRDYMREFRRFQSVSSYGELHQTLLDSDLIFVGDYHTLRQSQEVAVRLLERAAADARPVCLALEMIHAEHQDSLDAFMAGEITEARFLQAVEYQRTWNFSWDNHRLLFDAARRLQVRVLGINHSPRVGRDRIRERDERIAGRLLDVVQADPEARVLVLIGDMHLASNHLPRALDRRLEAHGLQRRRLIVYQNSDTLYWTLAQHGSELDTQVVRLGRDRYCVMEVPPYVKLQSYLSWEQAVERLDSEVHLDEISEPTCATVLANLVAQLCRFLELPSVDGSCEVFTNLDESFFEALQSAPELSEERLREIQLHAFANRSCCVPELSLVYLPYFSVNHAAEEAMHLLQVRLAGAPAAADAYEGFYARALWSALGYAASRIINPRRRAHSEAAFRAFVRAASRELHEPQLAFRKHVARFVVQHKDHERARRDGRRGRLKQIYEQDLEVTLEVTLALGSMLGEQLADALRAGRLERQDLRQIVLACSQEPASRLYFDLVDRLQPAGA
jgi:hypothetical protein